MCGINGFISLSGDPVDQAVKHIDAMNVALAHRGPDDTGRWSDPSGRVHFGHRRLSIIDLSPDGHQPMVSGKGNAIVFNGEIYNFLELRQRFFAGYNFRSKSDTEILLLLYEKFGADCVQYLNGMFAFAIWDQQRSELFMARDRAGKKPLYYTLSNGFFAFSSELRALLGLPWVKKETDAESLYHFLTYNLLPPPLTMFRNINKLPPAHYIKLGKNGTPEITKYWEVEYENLSGIPADDVAERVLKGLQQAVNYRMVSDVPVGAFLSGGVDSSAIVALMTKSAAYPVKTYSIGFEGQPDYDELRFASKIAAMFGTDHHERIVQSKDLLDFLPHVVDAFDEPLADATCIPIYFLSETARKKGTIVVLTGDGSDELFAGYRNWQKYIRLYPRYRKYLKLPLFIRRFVASASSFWDELSPEHEILNRAALGQEFFWGGAKSFKESTKRNFLSEAFNRECAGLNSYKVIREYRESYEAVCKGDRKFSDTDWMCYLGFNFNVPNYYLHRMDRLGMANSIEIRSPFLDADFVNLALSIDGSLKSANAEPKYILKKSLSTVLPPEILYRKKMGFNVPLRKWAGEVLIDYIETNLSGFCMDNPQFSEEGIRNLLKRLKKGDTRATNNLWTVYFLIAWFRRWMN